MIFLWEFKEKRMARLQRKQQPLEGQHSKCSPDSAESPYGATQTCPGSSFEMLLLHPYITFHNQIMVMPLDTHLMGHSTFEYPTGCGVLGFKYSLTISI